MPFVVGMIFAMIANPMVKFLEKRIKINRKYGSVIMIVLVIGLVGLACYGSEHEVRTSGIESDDHPVVVSVHGCYLFVGFSILSAQGSAVRCALLLRREPLPDPALRPAEEPRRPESGCG